jgi:hypothetical protein
LQEELPDLRVTNYGVSGYGTVQSLLQFQGALQHGSPSVVILAYASFHDARNCLSRSWRKALSLYPTLSDAKIPSAGSRDDKGLRLEANAVRYERIPLSDRLVLLHLLDELYNRVELRLNGSAGVTFALIDAFDSTARQSGARLVLAGITDDPATTAMLRRCHEHGIETVDISVNLSLHEYTNYPFDRHPSPRAHGRYAERLGSILWRKLNAGLEASSD